MDIESARTFETGIILLPEDKCKLGLDALIWDLKKRFPDLDYSLVPVLKSGLGVGKLLSDATGVPINPMQMSYYPESSVRLEKPVCLMKPDVTGLYLNRAKPQKLIFTEGLIDTTGTLQEAVKIVKSDVDELGRLWGTKLPYPEFYIYAFASKNLSLDDLPPASVAFYSHKDVWIWGACGIDDEKDLGRDEPNLKGKLSPFARVLPERPYFAPSWLTIQYSRLPASEVIK